MKYINSIFGRIQSPESFSELLTLTESDSVYFWRGQSNINWKIDSGAVRRLGKHSSKRISEFDISFYEKNLIKEARKRLLDFDEHNRKMSDLELLAKLQHHGAATRLVDFSKSLLVALFFCSNSREYMNDYGILIGVNTHIIGGHEESFDFNMTYETFENLLSKQGDNYIYCVAPPSVSNRISAQHALFLCSKYVEGQYGSICIQEDLRYYRFIAISPELKKECNQYLTNCFDITFDSMFPDLDGFCDINSTYWDIYAHHRW